jgi:BirA family biotin operon repressor/biotin-[acetyl-CoA-carboxylase] ligase
MKNWKFKNFTIRQFEELGSTNAEAFKMAEVRQIFDREVILANCQNAGRGRMDRIWSSPKGNLYFSLVLQPQALIADVAQISFVAIVALRHAVEELLQDIVRENILTNAPNKERSAHIIESETSINVQNKWPNDLLINEKKVAGLLLESKINQKNCEFVILGIGVNINSNPSNTIFPASNLQEFKIEITPEILLQKFLDKFENLYQNWQNFGFANVRNAWLSKAYKLKEKITVKEGEGKTEGIFADMDSDGSLILLVDGLRKKITTADVS